MIWWSISPDRWFMTSSNSHLFQQLQHVELPGSLYCERLVEHATSQHQYEILHSPFIGFVLGRLTLSITGHNLDLVYLHQVSDLSELHVVQHKRPHVITEPVCVQRALQDGNTVTQHSIQCRRNMYLTHWNKCNMRRNSPWSWLCCGLCWRVPCWWLCQTEEAPEEPAEEWSAEPEHKPD